MSKRHAGANARETDPRASRPRWTIIDQRLDEGLAVLAPWRGADSVRGRLRRSWWLRADEVRKSLRSD